MDPSADALAVHSLLQRLNEAWAQGDADAFGAVFAEDADYVVFDGTHLKGRAAIVGAHRPLFQGFMRGSRLGGDPPTMRFVTPDVALIHSKGAILFARQKRSEERRVGKEC
jgi:uncharacterized protein (TIGR02246 family)